MFFPNQACLLGSYSKERISVSVSRESGSPVTKDRFPPRCQMEIWESGRLGIIKSRNLSFCPFGIEVGKQVFRTASLITGQKFQGVGLKLTAFILTLRDPSSHLCQKIMRFGVGELLQDIGRFQTICLREFERMDPDSFPKSQISKIKYSVHSE